MDATIRISPETYRLLEWRAKEAQSTPEAVAETALRLQLGNSAHIEQRQTASGLEAYLRGTRVAVRHIAAFMQAGFAVEEIIQRGLPQIPAAGIHEAIAYYHDHKSEIEAELRANSEEEARQQLRSLLTPEQYGELTGPKK